MASGAKKTGGFTCSDPGCFNNDKRNRGVSKDKKLKKYGFKKFQEETLNRRTVIEFVVNTWKVGRKLT